MTPVLQTAITGLVWAVSVSLVIFVSSLCTTWIMGSMKDVLGTDREKQEDIPDEQE